MTTTSTSHPAQIESHSKRDCGGGAGGRGRERPPYKSCHRSSPAIDYECAGLVRALNNRAKSARHLAAAGPRSAPPLCLPPSPLPATIRIAIATQPYIKESESLCVSLVESTEHTPPAHMFRWRVVVAVKHFINSAAKRLWRQQRLSWLQL